MRIITGIRGVLTAAVVLAGSANAQQAEICNAALASGIRDNYYVLTERDQFEQYQKRLCDARFSSYQAFQSGASGFKLDIPLAEGLLGLSGTSENKASKFNENYQKYCEATYFDSSYRERFVSYTSRVSAALADSWLECQKVHTGIWLAANQKGIYISVTPQENFAEFTVNVSRRTATTTPLRVADITPSGVASCVREGKPFGPGSEAVTNEFAFTCTKPQHRAISISVDTSEGLSNTVLVPAYTSKIAEINDRLTRENRQLNDSLRSLEQRLSAIGVAKADEQIHQPRVGGNRKQWTDESSCPDGYYVAGFVGQDHDGGGYCYDCMSRFNVICRPFSTKK